MLSLAIGKEGQNARLAAKLTGWRIDIRSQSALERAEEAPSTFEPFVPGEEPDIDIIEEAEEVAAAAMAEPRLAEAAPAASQPAAPPQTSAPAEDEEEIPFSIALAQIPIPDREEREAEDYGEEDEEEYEIPVTLTPEQRPTTIRFAEDVLPKRPEEVEEAKKPAAKKTRRPVRFEEEDDMDDIDYTGRIH
jgi:N utilization substance protein A